MDKKFKILAIDLGYSSLKYTYYDENGKMVNDKIISATAKLPEAPIEQDDDSVFRLNTDWWCLGPAALRTARSYQMPLETFEDMKAVYPAWISYMMKKFSHVKWDRIAIGLSMAYSERADELLSHIYESLLIDPATQLFVCLPQALASVASLNRYGGSIRDNAAHATENNLDNYVLCDGGYSTIDLCAVINKKSAAGATIGIPDTGVICIARDIADYIFKNFEYRISIKEAQTVVDTGILRRRGREVNLSEVVDKFTKRYLMNVLDLLENKYSEFLDVAESLVFVGGIVHFINKSLEDPNFRAEVEKHFPVSFIFTPKDSFEYYNSISYLLITEGLLAKG